MLGPLVSESFKNNQARGTATFDASGTHGTAAQSSGTITYNAINQSYTLTTGGGSLTFLPAEIDASQSSAGAVVYAKKSGTTSDFLTVTRPGTSGPVTYKYVGGAFWEHSVTGATTGSGSIDAIAYGVQTPAGGVPVSGTANYGVDLIGIETTPSGAAPLTGSGLATIDFSSGAVFIVGTLVPPSSPGSTSESWSAASKMGASGSFSGTFRFEDFGTFKGTLAGQLYGPTGEEVGASFAASQSDGRIAAGTILGRKGPADAGNASFNAAGSPLTNSQTFSASESRINFDLQGTSGSNNGTETFSNTSGTSENVVIRFDATTGTYTLAAPDLTQSLKLGQSYTTSGSPYGAATLDISRPGNADYVRLASWSNFLGQTNGTTRYRLGWAAFGMLSPVADVPRTGSAGYLVTLYGSVADKDRVNTSTLGGTGGFWVDFAAGQFRAKIPIVVGEDYHIAGRAPLLVLGTFNMNGTLSGAANGFSGSSSFDGVGAYTGTVNGGFYGPSAGEVGGSFSLSDGTGGFASGAFAGAKDGSVTDPSVQIPKLSQLTAPTDLTFSSLPTPFTNSNDQPTKFTYNPATGTYAVTYVAGYPLSSGTITYGSSTLDASQPISGFDSHTATLGSETLHAVLVRPDNSTVQLSYLSFGEFSRERGIYGDYRFFAYYGNAMPMNQAPRTGSASYTGLILAYAYINSNSPTPRPEDGGYRILGASALSVDWASQSFTANFNNLAGKRLTDGSIYNFNPISFIGALNSTGFATTGNSSHVLNGQFFGSNAAEYAATFFERTTGVNEPIIEITGVAAGKKN